MAPELVFAADLGGTKLACALVTRAGRIVVRCAERVDASTRLAPVAQIARLARELRREHAFVAAGVAVPGLARRDGTVWAPNLRGWSRMPLARELRRELRVPVAVESDRNAAVLGEAWRGAARGKKDVVVLVVGTGIGAGIIAGGELVRGAHELAGCAGWLSVSERRPAGAARTGCLEALAAGPALARSGGGKLTTEMLAQQARAGSAAARRRFRDAGRWLGYGVADIVSLFDPEIIVLAGGMSAAADLFLPELRRAMRERAQPLAARQVRIAVSRLGGDANLLGAARVAFAALSS
jgi:glucokinase